MNDYAGDRDPSRKSQFALRHTTHAGRAGANPATGTRTVRTRAWAGLLHSAGPSD
jgi:hypothetical protein